MSWATSEAVAVLVFLLPGFVAAAVFYALTSHPRPGEFARVVQALVFTTVGQAATGAIRWLTGLLWPGWEWPAGLELAVSLTSAVVVALLAVYVANHDTAHRLLRRIGITAENSYPTELYSAFAIHSDCYVVLHLADRRRLYGWVEERPSHPPEGYFRLSEPEWLQDDGGRSPVSQVVAMLVPAGDVTMIEFLETPLYDGDDGSKE